jgi:hypothetical protein
METNIKTLPIGVQQAIIKAYESGREARVFRENGKITVMAENRPCPQVLIKVDRNTGV